jgi:single-strand DNA-binding protein
MNNFNCIGRLTRNPELTTTNNGTSVAKFCVAVDRRFKNEAGEKVTDFFNIVAWKGLGENIAKYCKKGSKVFVAGELQNRSYEDKEGNKKYITEIIANECEFLDSKNTNNDEQSQPHANLEQINDDDLPF